MDSIYPVIFIDAIHYSVRDNGVIRKLAAYVMLGINLEGKKEVLNIQVGEIESAKYWLSVLNELKNRGVKDVLIICADGLTGIKDAINAAFPETEYQRCIVHKVRNTLKYVSDKDRKEFAADLKKIYNAPNEQLGAEARDEVTGIRLLNCKFFHELSQILFISSSSFSIFFSTKSIKLSHECNGLI